MYRTKNHIKRKWRSDLPYMLDIPAGTRCKPTGDGDFWVDDLSWCVSDYAKWDFEHRGIRLDPPEVEQIQVRIL